MTDRRTTLSALTRCYDDLEALITDLGHEEWATPSLCPDWTVQGVVTHLAGVEDLLTGWLPAAADEPPPFQKMGSFVAAVADLSGPELAERTREILARRSEDLAGLTDDDMARPGMTPVGPGTYGRFMNVRVFDFWVHQRDITLPLGRPTDDSGSAAEIALDEVHQSMGYIVGKKIGLPDGMSIRFDLDGGISRQIAVAVEGRAGLVDTLDAPSVTVQADTTTFIMLACGRIDPQAQIDAGRISWTGNDEWGDQAARNLRFTM